MTNPPVPAIITSWQTAPDPVILSPGGVHIWRANLDVGPLALRHLQESLSADEMARAERFYSAEESARYAAARGILRALLAQYAGIPTVDLSFCYGAHGKPALAPSSGTGDLRFNLSHSHGLALFAFALRREIGVDLEYVRPFKKEEHVAERFFSAQEVAGLRAFPQVAQTEAFFHCWTRKEAYVKARGGGLSIGLASFTVSLAQDRMTNLPITSHDDPEANGWSIRALAPGDGYVAAVAAQGKDWSLALWQWM